MEHNDYSETNDRNKHDLRKNISEETEHSKKSETNDSYKDDLGEIFQKKWNTTTMVKNDIYKDDLSQNILEEMDHNNNSETNYSNREDLSETFLSQEPQSVRKLAVAISRNSSRR